MKKYVLLVLLFTVSAYLSANDSLATKKYFFEAYIGGPNIYPLIVAQSYNNNFDLTRGLRPDYETAVIQPIGFKVEYKWKENLGLGIHTFYSRTTLKWSDALYHYNSEISKLRFVLTANYYFRNEENRKYYFTGQLGYSLNNYTFEHYSDIDSIKPIHPKPEIKFNSPFSFRIGIGAKYYFDNDFGIFAEAGIGGPLVLAGISYKF